jgi:hypothetical protein
MNDPNKPIRQPLGAGAYAVLALVTLAIAIGLLVFYIDKVPELVSRGVASQIHFFLVIPWGLAAAAFLFGAMRSYALFKGKRVGSVLELGGPVVLFVLVAAGGLYYMSLLKEPFTLTVRAHAADGREPIIARGDVTVDLGALRQTRAFDTNGEARFPEVPQATMGDSITVIPRVRGYEASARRVLVADDVLLLALDRDTTTTMIRGRVDSRSRQTQPMRVMVLGDTATTTVDAHGQFALRVRAQPGDRVRIQVYAGVTMVFDDYVVVGDVIVLDARRRAAAPAAAAPSSG